MCGCGCNIKLLIVSASVCMDEERVHGEVLCGEMRQERVSGSNTIGGDDNVG